ncbi:MAG: hypothetical protein AAGH78_05745 [Cyanobacteria bacterium P01_H01_bin.58]
MKIAVFEIEPREVSLNQISALQVNAREVKQIGMIAPAPAPSIPTAD